MNLFQLSKKLCKDIVYFMSWFYEVLARMTKEFNEENVRSWGCPSWEVAWVLGNSLLLKRLCLQNKFGWCFWTIVPLFLKHYTINTLVSVSFWMQSSDLNPFFFVEKPSNIISFNKIMLALKHRECHENQDFGGEVNAYPYYILCLVSY